MTVQLCYAPEKEDNFSAHSNAARITCDHDLIFNKLPNLVIGLAAVVSQKRRNDATVAHRDLENH